MSSLSSINGLSQWLRLLLGLSVIFGLFQWSAGALASYPGEAGLIVGLDREELPVADWNEATRKFAIGRHECHERRHLLKMRGRVISNQQASHA